jgi:hypothetical protein
VEGSPEKNLGDAIQDFFCLVWNIQKKNPVRMLILKKNPASRYPEKI